MIPIFQDLTKDQLDAIGKALRSEAEFTVPDAGKIEYVVVGDRDLFNPSTISTIFRLNGKLYRFDGYYDSFSGTEWGHARDIYEVEEKTVSVTTYPRIKP